MALHCIRAARTLQTRGPKGRRRQGLWCSCASRWRARCPIFACSPSRSSLLSGRLPQHVNIHNDDQTRPGAGIPAEMATVPSKLREAGYRTHHLGK